MSKLQHISILTLLSAFLAVPVFAQLTAGGDTTICKGGQAQLSATGGGASYYWTSIPFDPSLLIPQQQYPVVAPQVSTMYIVQSNIATGNLILNGTFELGVVGFSSDYVNNQSSIMAEGTYAVVTDANTVHPNFFCDEDHTSGSGKFMAVNGSGVPNVRVWHLDLQQVQPHHQYEFSTWITSLFSTNPALLQFSINGQLMAEPFQAYSTTCDWYQFFYIWESDTNSHADISIVNQNTILSGNDFALDDISFATVTVHYDTVWVEVLPQYNSPFAIPQEACAQETIIVTYSGNAPDTADYHWDFDGADIISGSGQGPYEISYAGMGSYQVSLYVTGAGCPSDTTIHPVTIGESPTVAVSADNTFIPYGTSTVLHGSWTGGAGPFQYYWEPSALLVDPGATDPQTIALTGTTEFTFYVMDESAQCTGFGSIIIQVTGGPLSVEVTASPSEVCAGGSVTLNALPGGGTGSYTYLWSSDPPGFTSDLPSPVVIPTQTTTYYVAVDDGLSIIEGMTEVVLHPLPQANAGTDQVIPYGTATSLHGVATGGSGTYQWHWSPEEWLEDANVQDPVTLQITEPVLFSLEVTDPVTGCAGEEDFVLVSPEGGPLGVVIQTETPEICAGESTVLTAMASGGNQGNYSYTWADEFGNSYPATASITVSPSQTTMFHVTVFDEFNYIDDFFTLSVFPGAEFVLAGGAQTVYACPYDTVMIVPEPNPEGWNYLWSNGSVEDTLFVGSTGIGYDVKSYTLTVETENGCSSSRDITIIFDFGNCFGTEEHDQGRLLIYPNPGHGLFTVEMGEGKRWQDIQVFDIHSRMVYRSTVQPNGGDPGLHTLDLQHLPSGVYIVILRNGHGSAAGRVMILPD